MYSTGSPDEWDLLWEFPDKADIESPSLASKVANVRQGACSSKALFSWRHSTYQLAKGLHNAHCGECVVTAASGPGSIDTAENRAIAVGADAANRGVAHLSRGSCAGAPTEAETLTQPEMDQAVATLYQPLAFPTLVVGATPTSSTNSVESSPERPAFFPLSDVAAAPAATVTSAAAPATHGLSISVSPPLDTRYCPSGRLSDGARTRSASNSTGGAAADSCGACTSGSVPAAPARDPDHGRGDVTSPRRFESARISAADLGHADASRGLMQSAVAAALDTAMAGGGLFDAGGAAGDGPVAEPSLSREDADTEALWSLESLRQLCRSRDPRLGRQGQLRQPQQPEQPQGPGTDLVGAAPETGPEPSGDIRGGGAAPAPASAARPRSQTMPVGVVGGSVGGRGGVGCPPPPQPEFPLPPLRRAPRTTTARLLSRLRPTGGAVPAAAPSAGAAAAAGAGGSGRLKSSSAYRLGMGRLGTATADVFGAGSGSGGKEAAVGGRKRKGSQDGAPRRVKGAARGKGRTSYDGGYGDTSDAALGDSDCEVMGLKPKIATSTAKEPLYGSAVGRRTTSSLCLMDEVQRALAAAEVDEAAAAAPPRSPPSASKTAWRLPPLRGRFDFLQRVKRRRVVGRVSAAGAAAAAAPPSPSSPWIGTGTAAGSSGAPSTTALAGMGRRRHSSQAYGAGDTQAPAKDTLGGGGPARWVGGRWTYTSCEAPGNGNTPDCNSGGGSGGSGTRLKRRADNGDHDGDAGGGGGGGSPALTLLQALDVWRARRAQSVRKSPEALLRLGLLADLAARCPTSVLDLEELDGLPRPFTRKYGQEVLEICRNHVHVQEGRAAAAAARARRAAAAAAAEAAPAHGSSGGAAPAPTTRRGDAGGADGSRQAAWEAAFAAAVGEPSPVQGETEEERGRTAGGGAWQQKENELERQESALEQQPANTRPRGAEVPRLAKQVPMEEEEGEEVVPDTMACNVGPSDVTVARKENVTATVPPAQSGSVSGFVSGFGTGLGSRGNVGSAARSAEAAPSAPRRILTKAQAAARHRVAAVPVAPKEVPGTAAPAPAGFTVTAATAAPATGAAGAGPRRSTAGVKRPANSRRHDTRGVAAARKRVRRDSPRSAATAAAKPEGKAKAALDLAAAVAMSDGSEPSGWLPLPEGCKARGGSHLAYAPTPHLQGAHIRALLGILAEAGPAAAAAAAAAGGDAAAATPPTPDVAGGDGEAGPAQPSDAPAARAGGDADAMLPTAAVAVAAAAQALGRPAGLEHIRRLRTMVEAALPAWEVRRVLACRALGPTVQSAAVLRLEPGSSRDAVRVAFRRLSLLVHPDKNRSPGAAEAFALVSGAASKLLGSAA